MSDLLNWANYSWDHPSRQDEKITTKMKRAVILKREYTWYTQGITERSCTVISVVRKSAENK